MEALKRTAGTAQSARPVSSAFLPFRRHGHAFRLAQGLSDLEACLAWDRHAGSGAGEGADAPSAVPYCDFLMALDPEGRLAGVCRLMVQGKESPLPLSLSRFRLSPLATALRYARLEMLEVGHLGIAPGASEAEIAQGMWHAIVRYLDLGGIAFAMGRQRFAPASLERAAEAIGRLLEDHGPPPDLELEAGGWRSVSQRRGDARPIDEDPTAWLPAGLREGLRRGCRLAGDPVVHPSGEGLEFLWMAFRSMLAA